MNTIYGGFIDAVGGLSQYVVFSKPWLERFFESRRSVDHPVCKWIVTPVANH